MLEALITYLERNGKLTEENIALMKKILIPKTMLKGTFLVREGEIPKYAAFVCKGFLRSYMIDNKGKEHIIQFAPENWWISAKPVAAEEAPSSVFIDAIEDSEVLLIDRTGHIAMLEKVIIYADAFHKGIQKRVEAKEKRIVNALAATAEERYHHFLQTYPTIAQRVPQHMLASYLGITPETVSRIRRKQMTKK